MKKILYTLIAGAMALASCSNNDDAIGIDPSNATTVFTLGVDDAITRATTTIAPARYVMEVWSEDGTTAENVFEDGTKNRAEITTGNSFTVVLDQTKAYTCLFWADDNGTTYDAAALKVITIKTGKIVTEAYHAKVAVAAGKNPEVGVTLGRAVAKVTLSETDAVETAKPIVVKLSGQYPSFDVMAGEASGTAAERSITLAPAATTGTIATLYLLATSEKQLVEMKFTYADEVEKTISNVPLQQNYRTNIRGEFSSQASLTLTATTDDTWGGVDNEVETDPIPPFTVTNTVKGGLQAAIAAAGLTASQKIIILGPVDDVDMRYVGSLTTLKELDLSGATLWGKAAENAAETENTLTYQAFYRGDNELNTTLTAVTLPASLEIIGYRTFYECIALTSIAIPASVTSIGEEAFFECTKLETITFAGTSQLETIGNYAFNYCSALTSIAIPASVTSIGGYAFYSCSKLATVTFAGTSQLETIGEAAFYSCSALTSIGIPASVTSIGLHAFEGCYKLAMVTFAGTSQLETIGNYVFNSCTALTSIAIPASVTSIGLCAFTSCSLLKSITLHNSTAMIPYTESLLVNTPALTDIYVPATLVDTYKAAEGWKDFAAKIQPIP